MSISLLFGLRVLECRPHGMTGGSSAILLSSVLRLVSCLLTQILRECCRKLFGE